MIPFSCVELEPVQSQSDGSPSMAFANNASRVIHQERLKSFHKYSVLCKSSSAVAMSRSWSPIHQQSIKLLELLTKVIELAGREVGQYCLPVIHGTDDGREDLPRT